MKSNIIDVLNPSKATVDAILASVKCHFFIQRNTDSLLNLPEASHVALKAALLNMPGQIQITFAPPGNGSSYMAPPGNSSLTGSQS
jgi:hypothetical protein